MCCNGFFGLGGSVRDVTLLLFAFLCMVPLLGSKSLYFFYYSCIAPALLSKPKLFLVTVVTRFRLLVVIKTMLTLAISTVPTGSNGFLIRLLLTLFLPFKCSVATPKTNVSSSQRLSFIKGVMTRLMVDALSELCSPFIKGGNSAGFRIYKQVKSLLPML